MLFSLEKFVKVAAFVLAALVLFPSSAVSNPKASNLEPVWEKINGEWKFNKTTNQKHESLVYVITTTDNKLNKNIITKDMVKLPFVLIIEQDKKEEISLH
jgi:hypothetical protein